MKNGVEDFVVESTPVLDLKKHGLPTQSASVEGSWDSDRTEVYADADGESAVASLVGDRGEVYPITTFPFVMGRGAECDLVLQGKGVSRRHAEIIFQAGRFVVNDLESLNGIKVNGYKVSRVILEENDNIKLGEVSLTFRSRDGSGADAKPVAAPKAKNTKLFARKENIEAVQDDTFGPSPAKKLLTQGAALIALLLVGVAGYQYWLSQNQPSGRIVEVSTPTSAAKTVVPPATQSSDVQAKASAAVTSSVDEPAVAPKQSTAASANSVATVNVDAVEPPPSFAPPPSISQAVENPPVVTGSEAVVKPKTEAVPPAAASTKPAASTAKPVAVAPAVKPKPAQDNNALADRARQNLNRAQDLYFKGDAQSAINLLKPLVENSGMPQSLRGEVRTAYANYSSLFDQYSAGQKAYGTSDKEGAFEIWNSFMEKESSLFGGRKSAYSQNISSRVVGEYVTLGNDAAKKGDHHKAYRMWQKALELGDNVAARIAIDNANNKAMQLYRQALRLEYVNTSKARALWQEVTELLPPGTEYHTKASAKLAWYERWGA
ncbi:MAG: FHA domain-containing protein [Gammaproteobacteria bacterium]